jgi:hypothetical protein
VVDQGEPKLPDELPPVSSPVAIDVSGNGTVVSSARHLQAASKRPIVCGTAGFQCYARFTAKTTLQFVAKPDPGYRFVNWGGACFGQGSTCTLTVAAGRSLSAEFAPIDPAASVSVRLDQPLVSIHWRQSVGSGRLVVTGSLSEAALIRLDLRRPAGGPLLTQQESVQAGRFRLAPQISKAALPKGAVVLPGGFVVVLTGRVGSVALPRTLRTVVLPPPPEGVVRRAFASVSSSGRAASSLRFGVRSAWATFVFASQPAPGRRLSVRWFGADGRVIGTRTKSNRPTVQTAIAAGGASLPKGRYRVELRSGNAAIATHSLTIRR